MCSTLNFPKKFSAKDTYSILMHSSCIMLLLDLFTLFPNTALHYATNVWKTFINKESDLRWWKCIILPMLLASARRMISRLQLPHFIFHGHTKVSFFSFTTLPSVFVNVLFCSLASSEKCIGLQLFYNDISYTYESVVGNFLFVPFEKKWGLTNK